MDERIEALLTKAGLEELSVRLGNVALPAIGMSFKTVQTHQTNTAVSKLGGHPDLPKGFVWPKHRGRPLDFLLQVNLVDLQPYDLQGLLPTLGLLTFFYDLETQPWGYHLDYLDGFCVAYTPIVQNLERREGPRTEDSPAERSITFHSAMTIPHYESRAFNLLVDTARMSKEDKYAYIDAYLEVSAQVDELYSLVSYDQAFTKNGGYHRMLGHSTNIQGDMQLQAQLVMDGLSYRDFERFDASKRQEIEAGADDWILLLQLDSDDSAKLMWGDIGMLYFWIRKNDLAQRCFDHVWMTLQC